MKNVRDTTVNGKGRNERLGDALDRGILLAFDIKIVTGFDGEPKAIANPAAKLLNGTVLTLCGILEAAGLVGVPYCDEKSERSGRVFHLSREYQGTPDGATQLNNIKAMLTLFDVWELIEAALCEVPQGFLDFLDSIAEGDDE